MNNEKKVALLFWGLTRGLKYIVDSINKMIIEPLKEAGYKPVIYMHTFYFNGKYNNDRHGIKNFTLDFEEYKLLKPDYLIIENQDEVKERIDLKSYRKNKDHFNNNYQSNDNYILSLYSQGKVTNLLLQNRENIDYVIYLRPDVLYLKKFNVNWLDLLEDNTMLLPNWKTYKNIVKYSENDRFCCCKASDAKKYGDILDYLRPYSLYRSIIAESFLGFLLNQYFKVKIIRIGFRFRRVLPNGELFD